MNAINLEQLRQAKIEAAEAVEREQVEINRLRAELTARQRQMKAAKVRFDRVRLAYLDAVERQEVAP